jgi:hypothetical protein
VVQNLPEHRRSSTSGRYPAGDLAGNPSPTVSCPSSLWSVGSRSKEPEQTT